MSRLKTTIPMIFSLALPIIIENILQTLLGTTDTYFAGQLTDNAIAGIGLTNIVQVMTNALQGAGDTKFPMYSTLIGIWGIRLCLGYFLAIPCGMGLRGVWTAYTSDMTVRGILLSIRFYRGKWKTIKV